MSSSPSPLSQQEQAVRAMRARDNRFDAWLRDLLPEEDEFKEAQEPALADSYYRDFMREVDLSVDKAGFVTFGELDPATTRVIGGLPVLLNHFTSSALDASIAKHGILPGRKTASRWQGAGREVFLTSEGNGPAVEGYCNRAVAVHGGERTCHEVVMRVDELAPDPDDADLSCGRRQFVVPCVPPERILGISSPEVVRAALAVPLADRRDHLVARAAADGIRVKIANPDVAASPSTAGW